MKTKKIRDVLDALYEEYPTRVDRGKHMKRYASPPIPSSISSIVELLKDHCGDD